MNDLISLRQDMLNAASKAVLNTPEEILAHYVEGRTKGITELVDLGLMSKDAAYDRIALIRQAHADVLKSLATPVMVAA